MAEKFQMLSQTGRGLPGELIEKQGEKSKDPGRGASAPRVTSVCTDRSRSEGQVELQKQRVLTQETELTGKQMLCFYEPGLPNCPLVPLM